VTLFPFSNSSNCFFAHLTIWLLRLPSSLSLTLSITSFLPGVLYVCVGYILRIALYGFLPLSTLAPLSAITIICSIALEYVVLKDELKQITVICSVCIMAGVVMCIFSANLIDENYSLQSIQSLFLVRFNFVMTVSLCATILCCKEFLKQTTFFVNKNVIPKVSNNRNMNTDDDIDESNDNMNDKSNRHNHSSNYQGESSENDEVSTYSIAHDINSAYYNDYSMKSKDENLFLSYLGFFYLIFANAIFTGWFSVSSKAMIEIIKYVFIYGLKPSFLTHPGIFILLFLLPICSTIKLKYTWYALSVYSPLQYIPLYQSGVVLTNSLFGLIYFQVCFVFLCIVLSRYVLDCILLIQTALDWLRLC
jgi:Magnesium transporter NIPA